MKNPNKTPVFRMNTITLALLTLTATSAAAQQAQPPAEPQAEPEQRIETIAVTGSRIARLRYHRLTGGFVSRTRLCASEHL